MIKDHAQLVIGQVTHTRIRPARNRFVYPVFYVRLNLASLATCNSRWFGVNRARPVSIRTSDYGPRDGSSLELWMRSLLREHDIFADGEIWLQTFPRVFGYMFNPVSFWHCYDIQGRLCAVLAEVNNTFGETHRYLLRLTPMADQSKFGATASVIKHLHVSPFCHLQGEYHFRFRLGDTTHCTCIDYHDNNGLLLKTSVSGRALPLTERALIAALLRFPLLGFGIVARIYWQALRLWLKGVPFFRKPPAPLQDITLQKDISQ